MSSESTSPKICVIGGGATGLSLLWALKSQELSRGADVTLLHHRGPMNYDPNKVEVPELGGHSVTIQVEMDGVKVPVDLGVQFVCPLIYPNLHRMLELPEFKRKVHLDDHPELKLGVTINENVNWGNFPQYQSGPLFDFFQKPEIQENMDRFVLAVYFSEFRLSMTLNEYFAEEAAKGKPYAPGFIDFALFPYLSILNGYGGSELLKDATFEEMVPLFVDLDNPGPLAGFQSPGKGWQRFRHGSTSWIEAMANYARGQGHTTIRTGAKVTAVFPSKTGSTLTVRWDQDGVPKLGVFDKVVFTTDMDTNAVILNNPENTYWPSQQKVIEQFDLKPGACYIHTDDAVFPTYLKTRDSTVDFCAAYSAQEPGKTPPYNVSHSYSTYNIQNMVPGAPANLYLSMYGHDSPQHPPHPDKTFVSATWKHGSFLGPQLRDAARQVHQIQGMGNMWFAGNNTCMDSEEAALLSAMVIAEKLFPNWTYPFLHDPAALLMYEVIKLEFMFPPSFSRGILAGVDLEGLREKLQPTSEEC